MNTQQRTYTVLFEQGPRPGALAELMEQWRQEDAALSEEEAEQADKDTQAFKAALNANRKAKGSSIHDTRREPDSQANGERKETNSKKQPDRLKCETLTTSFAKNWRSETRALR